MNFRASLFVGYKFVSILILLGAPYLSSARTIRIPIQHTSIQEAIDLAWNGDTIILNEGRYFESINLRGKAITIGSYYLLDGDTTHISKTIIDGSRSGGNDYYSTVVLNSGEDTLSVIKGLTITGGRGSRLDVGAGYHWGGGGILVYQSGGKIECNIIEGNSLSYELETNTGAGIFAGVGNGKQLVVRNNVIRDNTIRTAQQVDAGGLCVTAQPESFTLIEKNQIIHNSITCSGPNSAHGGGLSVFCNIPFNCKITVRKNTIAYNEASSYPGSGIISYGGGINVIFIEILPEFHGTEIPILISENYIHHNSVDEKGGGISFFRVNERYINQPDSPTALVINNRILNNTSMDGAGISNINASIILINNTLNNIATNNNGGEIFNDEISYNFDNSGIVNAFGNQIQGKWKDIKGVYHDDFPRVHTFSHSWRVIEYDSAGISLSLVPPPWRRWWTLMIYVAVLLLGLLAYRKYLFYRINMKLALENERKENEHIREMEKMKSRFFANISHEFRTPLSLIYGPVNNMLREEKISENGRRQMQYVKGSVERLMQLINQLLDLSKLESGTVKLQVSQGNLKEFVDRVAGSFLSLAESKKIKYQYHFPGNFTWLYFDSDKLEKILNNLLSNALKFTPEEGEVKLILEYSETDHISKKQHVLITVSDSGPGMSEEVAARIFDRYYSVDNTPKNNHAGTGIGLSLVKELVDIYNGTIQVRSSPGEGTVISVSLPVGKELFSSEEIQCNAQPETSLSEIDCSDRKPDGSESSTINNSVEYPKDTPLILVIEDHKELRSYIVSLLNGNARVYEAENGEHACGIALETIPDLIISDLMMPVMDGIEVMQYLKNDERTSHIPFMMLTARGDLESKIESFEKGVDEYIEKPFHPEELQARVSSILMQRQMLRAHYRKEFLQDPEVYVSGKSRENFMDKVVHCIKDNLSNPDFSVVMLSEALNVSRVQLYRKIIALTGFSPVEFIRNFRLRVASTMFRKDDMNVTQVMLEVGFSTPSYFTECFRKLFGCNPSEYRKTAKKDAATGISC